MQFCVRPYWFSIIMKTNDLNAEADFILDLFTRGFHHVVEKIIMLLPLQSILHCKQVSQDWLNIVLYFHQSKVSRIVQQQVPISPTFYKHLFCQFPFAIKSQTQAVSTEKMRKTLDCKKAAHKMFVKLTTGQQNIRGMEEGKNENKEEAI